MHFDCSKKWKEPTGHTTSLSHLVCIFDYIPWFARLKFDTPELIKSYVCHLATLTSQPNRGHSNVHILSHLPVFCGRKGALFRKGLHHCRAAWLSTSVASQLSRDVGFGGRSPVFGVSKWWIRDSRWFVTLPETNCWLAPDKCMEDEGFTLSEGPFQGRPVSYRDGNSPGIYLPRDPSDPLMSCRGILRDSIRMHLIS